jgi:hypothetical protein
VLPAGLTGRLDLNKLTRVPGSFVDAELRWRHSELLFTAPLEHQEAFIYILVEHQSSPDPLMAFRILRYLIRIWDNYLATRLPAVIPLVVHHNRPPWTGPTDIRQLLDLDPDTAEAVGDYLPQLRFLLDDLARLDEPALRCRRSWNFRSLDHRNSLGSGVFGGRGGYYRLVTMVASWSSRSDSATGWSQWGQGPPIPMRRAKLPHWSQRCWPWSRWSQSGHS